ncbi:MAG TPA: SPFH domain-containing protein, partial [Thermoleophilaceae bacterium]|nr:SPFH domain-containing protein [Thermoleophilaceae bacterium]
PWGVKVTTVEIKDVEIPQGMQRAMARQAEAERERRAKIINAEGEFQASQRLFDAAEIISQNPATIQLRYLQTLLELGSGSTSTIVFPLPIDLIEPLTQLMRRGDGGGGGDGGPRPPRPRPQNPRVQPGLEPTDEPKAPPVTPGLGPGDAVDPPEGSAS